MVLFWTLLILLAIGETNWQWDLGTVFGIIFVTCVLLSWIAFFFGGRNTPGHATNVLTTIVIKTATRRI
jgi:hypothetical protein